jgi:hypothetical protein
MIDESEKRVYVTLNMNDVNIFSNTASIRLLGVTRV